MSDENTDSMNQITQSYLEDAMDSGKDITDSKVRKEITEKIAEKFPDWDIKSVQSSLSKSKNKIAKKRGLKPSDLGVGKKKKLFDDAIDLQVDKDGKVEDTGLTAQNPKLKKDKDGKVIVAKTPSKLNESVFASTGNLAYNMFALTDDDMEELTEGEKKDLGNVMKALSDQYLGEKADGVIGIGAILGLFLNKKRKAKRLRKEREKKEGKKPDKKKNQQEEKKPVEEFQDDETSSILVSEGGRPNQ